MADIKDTIKKVYDIDIEQVNLIKLFNIENADITVQELRDKIAARKSSWQRSVDNGTNEKIVQRDKAYLDNIDKYEKILCDERLRKELYAYYNKNANPEGDLSFAREYFKLVAATKKVRPKDVKFFFSYFREQGKSKKAILEMLGKEFNVKGLGKDEKYEEENEEEGKKKNEDSVLIVNSFQEPTLLRIKKSISFYQQACESVQVCQKYPEIRTGFYEFLGIDSMQTAKEFGDMVASQREKAFSLRQELGQDFAPVVDLYNTLADVSGNEDVVDNFTEFKLLLKYPNLTPYMYGIENLKADAMEELWKIANREYIFRDKTDFILSYFKVIYDNFNIQCQSIRNILAEAEKKAKGNKVLDYVDKKTGRSKRRRIPVWANILHFLVYWPIFLFYVLFSTVKLVTTRCKLFFVPVFIPVFVATMKYWAKTHIYFDSLNDFISIFSKSGWLEWVYKWSNMETDNTFYIVLLSIASVVETVVCYLLPPFVCAYLSFIVLDYLNTQYDWIGMERTFQNILNTLRDKTEKRCLEENNMRRKSIPKILINLLCTMIVAVIMWIIV